MADIGTDSFIQIKKDDWDNLNRALRYIYNQLDAITGRRGLGADPSQKYDPVFTNQINMDGPAAGFATSFVRVLDTLIVFGQIRANPTTVSTATSFEMSLPLNPNFKNTFDGAGVAFSAGAAGAGIAIQAGVANQTAKFMWTPGDLAEQNFSFVFVCHVN